MVLPFQVLEFKPHHIQKQQSVESTMSLKNYNSITIILSPYINVLSEMLAAALLVKELP
jgi:hypothetical protein